MAEDAVAAIGQDGGRGPAGGQGLPPRPLGVEGDFAATGAVALRGAVDPDFLRRLRERAAAIFDLFDDLDEAQLAALEAPDFRFNSALPYRRIDRQFQILSSLHPAVMPLLRRFLGVPELMLRNCILRRLRPDRSETRASFHQDLQFLWPYGGPLLTVWIPLDPCDGSRPGLQILPRRLAALAGPSRADRLAADPGFRDYADRGRGIAYDAGIALTEADVARLAPGLPLWEPRLALGDVLVFDGMTVHRSALHPGMIAERVSVELRCAPPMAPPQAGRTVQP